MVYMGRNLISKTTEGIWTKREPEVMSHALPLKTTHMKWKMLTDGIDAGWTYALYCLHTTTSLISGSGRNLTKSKKQRPNLLTDQDTDRDSEILYSCSPGTANWMRSARTRERLVVLGRHRARLRYFCRRERPSGRVHRCDRPLSPKSGGGDCV